MAGNTLEIRHLSVCFPSRRGEAQAVRDVSLTVPEGGITGIVGESGCGKTMTARAVMGLIRRPGRMTDGEIWLSGRDVAHLPERERRALRGSEISMVFQEPMTALNTVMRVGRQVEEAILLHTDLSRQEAARRATEMLEAVGVPEAERRTRCYPHQLSGGLRQRVMIAMAMACRPKLLIADEPTTALDVTVEAQILRLLKRLREEGTAVLLISHNLGVIAQLCDTVYVMYAGQIVEQAEVRTLYDAPAHPYTAGLLGAVSSLRQGRAADSLKTIPGTVPDLRSLPAGCAFAPRCPRRGPECGMRRPEMTEIAPGHAVRCLRTGKEAEA